MAAGETTETYTLAAIGAAGGLWKHGIRPELTARRTWAVIGATVLAHELFCPSGELLSEGADRLISRHPTAARLGILALGLHIANVLPDRFDPVHQGFMALKKF